MIDNNLDFDVALYPYELVTYGETGQVCQNWMQYRLIKKYLEELTDEQMEAIQPAISSAPSGNPLTIYTGTPPPPTSPGTAFARRRRNAQRDKPPKNLCWFEWAATEIGDVHDQQRWYQYNPSLGTRLLKRVVVSES